MYRTFTSLLASFLLIQTLSAQEVPPLPVDSAETTQPLPPIEVRTPNKYVPVETRSLNEPTVSPQESSQKISADTEPPTDNSPQPSVNTLPKITVLKLRSMSASEVRPLLEGLGLLDAGEGVSLAVESRNNLLLLRGPDDKISNIRELVNLLDPPAPPPTPVDPAALKKTTQQSFGGEAEVVRLGEEGVLQLEGREVRWEAEVISVVTSLSPGGNSQHPWSDPLSRFFKINLKSRLQELQTTAIPSVRRIR